MRGIKVDRSLAKKAYEMIERGESINEVGAILDVHPVTVGRLVKEYSGMSIRDIRNSSSLLRCPREICLAVYQMKQDHSWKDVEARFGLTQFMARRAYEAGRDRLNELERMFSGNPEGYNVCCVTADTAV
jgi:hypothetical protein